MSTATAKAPAKKRGQGAIKGMQKIGRSLQLPVAALPAAGILNRLGQPDVFGKDGLGWNKVAEIFGHAGGALFDNLALLFCIGVAIGFAKKADGTTAFAAVVGFLVYKNVLTGFVSNVTGKPEDPGVLGGVVVGITAAVLWEKYHRTRLPDWLGFFSGRRFIPILMSGVGLIYGVVFGYLWHPIGDGLNSFAEWLSGNGAVGSGIFGLVNRLLIPIGMHMLLNSFAWFQFGTFNPPGGGDAVHGDIARYFAGDPHAGMFMTGFFPIMMFALPAAGLAIAHAARPERRKAVMGMMISVGLTAFVTGVTEPIEFSFMFIAPVLYGVHAVLTGVSMALTWALGIRSGFTFSGGLFDYLLGWSHGEKQWLIIPIGLVFAVIYYVVFRVLITKLNIPTPGREPEDTIDDAAEAAAEAEQKAARRAKREKVPAQASGADAPAASASGAADGSAEPPSPGA
ncbi:PTS transporter subunit EIIC [Streptomyces sp. NPDC059740]|uniref:PTS transporter subunit EIIC n=1 Tax=Streptomyces sp. NPDC059740 TaxID=3346926 RepID=UPI003647C8EA